MSERHIELVGCLHHARNGQALIYTRVGDSYFRLHKRQGQAYMEYVRLDDRQMCQADLQNMTRFVPGFARFDSITNAPLTQLQLERMVLRLQALGYLTDEQQQAG